MVINIFIFVYVLIEAPAFFTLLLLLLLLGFQFVLLLRFLNRTNDELAAFFFSFLHKDVTRTFDMQGLEKNFSSLHASFNKMNALLREARHEKEQQQQFNQLVIDQVSTGLLTFEASEKITFCNQAAVDLFGVSGFSRLEQLEKVSPGLTSFIGNLKNGKPGVFPVRNLKGRQTPTSFTLKEFKQGTQHISLLAMQPIGTQLEHHQVASWQKLIRVLTHEMMNTMTPVVTLSRNIEKCLEPLMHVEGLPEESVINIRDAEKSASLIASRSHSLMNFVENYRSLSLLPEPRPEVVALEPFLQRQLDMFLMILRERNINCQVSVSPAGLECMMDPLLMSQVMVNLIKNAVEALDKVPEPAIRINAYANNGQVCISVHDNGCGIAPGNVESVFVPFFTTKKDGSGVGLSLCQQIMSLHQGVVELQSIPGNGCNVTLVF